MKLGCGITAMVFGALGLGWGVLCFFYFLSIGGQIEIPEEMQSDPAVAQGYKIGFMGSLIVPPILGIIFIIIGIVMLVAAQKAHAKERLNSFNRVQ